MQIHTQTIPLYLFRFECLNLLLLCQNYISSMLISSNRLCVLCVHCTMSCYIRCCVCFVHKPKSQSFARCAQHKTVQYKQKRKDALTHIHSAFTATQHTDSTYGGARIEHSTFASAITPSFSYLSVFVRQTYQKVDYESFSAIAFTLYIILRAPQKRKRN